MEAKSCFSHLLRNQSAPKRSLTLEKGMHCLSIICENHIFQVLLVSYNCQSRESLSFTRGIRAWIMKFTIIQI